LIKQEGIRDGVGESTQGESKTDLSFPSFHRSAGDEKATVEEAQTNSTNSRTHTPEQARRIAKLVHEGMAEHLAWAEVVGK
jgi:hypothetical protein